MKKHSFALLAALIGVLALCISAAVATDDMKVIRSEAFKPHTRPPAVYVHDAHNEKAKIDKVEDCGMCHHGVDKSGKLDKKVTSEGTPCVDCHAVNAKKGTPLMRAYHQQCIPCHVARNLGPTHCGGCHKR